MIEHGHDNQGSGPDRGVMWTTVIHRVILGLLVGALVSAFGVRLAMDVAQIAAMDVEEGLSGMRIAGRSAAVRMQRAHPQTVRDRGERRAE